MEAFFMEFYKYPETMAAIGTWLGVIVTTILTYKIIKQTKSIFENQVKWEAKINRRQMDLQNELNEQQIEIQKRQIRVDLFHYKRELYVNLLKVIELSSHLTEGIVTFDNLYNKSCEELSVIYKSCKKQFIGDVEKVILSISESSYLMPEDIVVSGLDIWKAFEEINRRFIHLHIAQYNLPAEDAEEVKVHNLKQIEKSCEIINSHAGTIKYVMIDELKIWNLDR